MGDSIWVQLGEAATFGSVLAAVIVALLRTALGHHFASRDAHHELAKRVDGLERTVRDMPTHADMASLSTRIQAVETAIAVVQAGQDSVVQGIARLEHMLNLLLEHELGKGEKR